MLGREDAAAGSHVALVVGDGASADDETSDVQVKRLVLGGVLGSQRVEYKLEVGWAFGCLAVEVGTQTEDLCRRDGNFALCSSHVVYLGRQTAGINEAVALLVVHHHVVDDDSVEEAQVDFSYFHLGAEFVGKSLCHLLAQEGLY